MDRSENDLREDIEEGARRLVVGITLHNYAVAAHLRLDRTAYWCLALLVRHGPMTPGQLTALTGLTSGGVTMVLDRLEQAELVTRRPGHADRRKVLVQPADRAADQLATAHEDLFEMLDSALGRCAPSDLTIISRFLSALGDNQETDTTDGLDNCGSGSDRRSHRPTGHIRKQLGGAAPSASARTSAAHATSRRQ